MSLNNCIKKFGKAINKSDADALIQKRDELVAKGLDEQEAGLLALRDIEESATKELDDILVQAGVKQKPIEKGIDLEVDGRVVDSNQYLAELDTELKGLDDIARCLYR